MLNKKLLASTSSSKDPYFQNVVMLLHGDGTNGAQNNTFIDGSTNNFTITRNGNATQGSLSPFGDRWSNYFDGTGDYLSFTNASALRLTNSGAFTIEFWVNPDSIGTNRYIFTNYNQSSPYQGYGFGIGCNLLNSEFQFWDGGSWRSFGLLTANVWTHVAISYEGSGTTGRVFLNGTQAGASFTINSAINYTAGTAVVGAQTASTGFFTGYISNLRIVKGTAVYTAAFTPPAAPLTAITNTSLLTCQSNRFIDNSSNNFTITRNGDVSVRPFNPFLPTDAYSTSVNGGSGYFDGTGDYLSFTGITLNGNFCLEAWYYRTGTPTNGYSVIFGGSSAASNTNNNQFTVQNNGSVSIALSGTVVVTAAGTAAVANAWNHIAYVRSGSSLAIFVNGVRQATGTSSINTSICSRIGDIAGIAGYLPIGYISNARIVVGSSVYDPSLTTLTVPTGPLTAISNTQLLLNFTNAGIIDSAADNVLETVGNAQISTSVKKYGTGSLAFDGTGDWLLSPNTADLNMGSGDFTIEAWVNRSSAISGSGSGDVIVSKGTNNIAFDIEVSTGKFRFAQYGVAVLLTSTTVVSNNTWYHVAVSRSGTTLRLFVNGTQETSTTSSANFTSTTQLGIGVDVNSTSQRLNGYIDDLRITKGVARYTANFTPPTAAFPDL